MLNRRVEEAGLNAWPSLQQILYDGWILRLAGGYTKRANSINPLYGDTLDLEKKIAACEQVYSSQNLPAIFRLTSFGTPAGLDEALARRSYRKADLTLVMHRELGAENLQSYPDPIEIAEMEMEDWLKLFCCLKEAELEQHQTHRAILEKIPGQTLFAALKDKGNEVACGLGVMENGFFGLFDLVTHPARRNQGYGTKLVAHMLGWARENGASHAYLQVVAANTPARQLYTKLGYQELYHYWYRLK